MVSRFLKIACDALADPCLTQRAMWQKSAMALACLACEGDHPVANRHTALCFITLPPLSVNKPRAEVLSLIPCIFQPLISRPRIFCHSTSTCKGQARDEKGRIGGAFRIDEKRGIVK